MTIGFIILEKLPQVGKRLALKFNKIWVFAKILLFVLVSVQVNVNVALDAGSVGIAVILAVAVLSILITVPIGTIVISLSAPKLLNINN